MEGTGRNKDRHPERVRVYQVMPRHFGNENETRKRWGTIQENGCGKFSDFSDLALGELKETGFTHLYLTGVPEQASGTDYPRREADHPDILKGVAGSPYAIRDYFDVCPDYAEDPEARVEEFQELLGRAEKAGLRVVIDFVPNHVARSYHSSVRPELSFGENDDNRVFFDRHNHFYYLQDDSPGGGPPLILPTAHLEGCSGHFPPEATHGRVTGNNAVTWRPGIFDWYETVKLNYGHDFTRGGDAGHLPGPEAAEDEVPDLWLKMDAVLAHWQGFGVRGFRVDMAHIVPMEFWAWTIRRARRRDPELFVMGEAYDTDPMKLVPGNVISALVEAGFDAAYDDQSYDLFKGLYEAGKWANDVAEVAMREERQDHSLRYLENHDEVRIANPQHWGGQGPRAGLAAAQALFGLGTGPVMIYAGQEVGEPAIGSEGFAGDDGRTSIFDYWSLPELNKWTNHGRFDGGKLSAEQRELREGYARLLKVVGSPAFSEGGFYGLNHANQGNPNFGRLVGEEVSGHWLLAYLRSEQKLGGETILVVCNLNPNEGLRDVRLEIPEDAIEWAKLGEFRFGRDRLREAGDFSVENRSVLVARLGAGEALYLELVN